jgi:hypothetical protein
MIPRLLDSQIKTMSGKEIAELALDITRHREREFTITLGECSVGVSVYSGNPIEFRAELARIIDSIREADRA